MQVIKISTNKYNNDFVNYSDIQNNFKKYNIER